jgi:hypothetical protein
MKDCGMYSLHDNRVYAYTVFSDPSRIVLHTEYLDGEAREFTDAVFSGVLAHQFQCVLPGSILFDVTEVEPEEIFRSEAALFERWKGHGWPGVDYADEADLVRTLRSRGLRGFVIASSYGPEGIEARSSARPVERRAGSCSGVHESLCECGDRSLTVRGSGATGIRTLNQGIMSPLLYR